MGSRKYIVGVVAVALLIWGPLDHSWPAWLAIRIAYLILIPVATWFLLGWIWERWQPDPETERQLQSARIEAIKLIGIAVAATTAILHFFAPLYAELQISLHGKEAKASVVSVRTVERDDCDRAWTVDLINYTFRTEDGYVLAGVNDANSSQTHDIIGSLDGSGRYPNARVTYVRSYPKWHRLNGWGYDGFGPPGSVVNILFRMALVLVPAFLAYWYVYDRLVRVFAVPGSNRATV